MRQSFILKTGYYRFHSRPSQFITTLTSMAWRIRSPTRHGNRGWVHF